jgi:hypothetical protein
MILVGKMAKKQLTALAGLVGICGVMLAAPAAHAVTVDIVLSESGFATNDTGSPSFNGNYGTFSNIQVGSVYTGPPGINFLTTNLSTSSTTAGTLTIDVTASGITSPTGTVPLASILQVNNLPSGWTVTESILYNSALVAGLTNTFSTTGTATPGGSINASGTYTLTERYVITATGAGTTNDTVTLSSTPLPAALPMMAGGLGVLGLFARRKKRNFVVA